MNIREPTEYERINCTRIILTGDQPWDVGDYDTPNPSTAYTSTSLIPSIPPIQKLLSIPFIQEDDMCQVVRANPSNTTVRDVDMLTYQARMGWMPMEVLTHTLSNTTQLAKNYFRLPLRRHFKSRFPQLNRNRLRETYATDTFFSSVTSIWSFTCAQLFSGKDSMFTKVYGMSTEAEGVVALETFVAEVGAPYHIISDNAKMQIGDAWKQVLRKYNISASTTEPHHPHQNPAERRIQELKKVTIRIMDHTNCPGYLWYHATTYSAYLLNHTASRRLGWKTPMEKAFGVTPDISALLQYAFYEPIYYHDSETSFPHTREHAGRFLGIAENIGDALTYVVLDSANNILIRSVLRSALDLNIVYVRALDTGDGGMIM